MASTPKAVLLLLTAVLGAGAGSLWAPAVAAQEAAPRGTGTLLGRVVAEETGEPLIGTAVEVRRTADSARVAETATNEDGRFRVSEVAEGEYFLRLSSLGRATVSTRPFELAYGESRDLGTLALPVEALEIDAITVSAERSAVTFEADRTSYNPGVLGGTEGASVTEALRNIPDLEIDIDGNITIRGSTPVIYIDGRPAPMTAEALALFLEQFPAEYLAKVEVMESPSARYGAEGSGGIVNLVLKEGVELGLSGTVFTSADTRGQYGAGARGTLQRGSWTFDANGMARLSDVERTGFDLRQNLLTDPAFLQQESWSDRSGLAGHFDFRTRFEPGERSRVFARGRISRSGSNADGLTTTTHLDDDEEAFLRYDRASLSDASSLSGSMSAGFDYRWEPRRHELELEVELRTGRDADDTREEIAEELLEDGALIPAELTIDDRTGHERELSLEADYTHPWGEEGRIETGLDIALEDTDDDRVIRFIDDPDADPQGTATDRGYGHREVVSAAYMTLGQQVGDLGLQVGLRAEHTDSRLEIPTGEAFTNDYLHLFPSANISYRFDRSKQVRLSYSRRVQRPSATVLNPVDRSTDPLTRRVGNPYIEPQFTHSFNLSASRSGPGGNLRLSAYYRHTSNDWAETTSVDHQGISTRTWENLASQLRYGASVSYFMRGNDRLRGLISINGGRQVRDASNLGDRYSGSSFRWSSRARVDASLTEALSAEGNFRYTPAVDLPQGQSDPRYDADFGLRYRFLENRASVRLSLRDPFGLRRESLRTSDVSYIQIARSHESSRSASISLSYSFGGEGRTRRGRR